jgi:D-serine deaminase-like pyridoxal phosphate-dependent protein
MKRAIALVVLGFTLGGCAEIAESMRRAEAERIEYARQCSERGGVIYNGSCMSPQDARAAQYRDFLADQAEKNRKAAIQAACVSSGGTWMGYHCYRDSFAPRNRTDVYIHRY